MELTSSRRRSTPHGNCLARSFRNWANKFMNRVASLIVLLALVLLFGGLFYLVVFRFFVPLFLAALFPLLFEPLHRWIRTRCGKYQRSAAALTTVVILLIVLLP